jgi:hypothetical protein
MRALISLGLLWHALGHAQPAPPVCTANRYGTAAQATAIELAMLQGTAAEVTAAIRAAQTTRGVELGCAELAYGYGANDLAAPSQTALRAQWQLHVDSAAAAPSVYDACPGLGRAGGAYALGGWLAVGFGRTFDAAALQAISANLLETQYLASRTPGRQATWTGLFGYAERLSQPGSCFVAGVVGEGVAAACSTAPQLCVTYQSGRFANERFVVGDYVVDPPIRDGGAAFDHSWAGVMFIEAALASSDPALRERYRRAALAAGEFALAEPPVRNHNYTAKLIWLLAALYDWTGELRFRDGLIDKLERNLLPAVLMDDNGDGVIDGLTVRFADLAAPAARVPGRVWDAHNALPWYHAMNSWAMVEAHLAFKSRGDSEWAARTRRYALAMMDNLGTELGQSGLAQGSTGSSQIPFAFATALWKLADAEGLSRPAWERGLWSVWNQGLGSAPGDNKTATAAMVYLRSKGIRHQSYAVRELKRSSQLPTDGRVSGAWYDPARDGEGLLVLAVEGGQMLVTWYTYDPADPGKQVWLLATGAFDGARFQGNAVLTRGTRFGALFNPLSVERVPWGTLSLEFSSCARATLTYSSTIAGYGGGERTLQQLAGTRGLACVP